MGKNHEDLNLIAKMDFTEYEDMYKIVDFLNKNLKGRGIIFGLTRRNCKDIISIYDGEESHKEINE